MVGRWRLERAQGTNTSNQATHRVFDKPGANRRVARLYHPRGSDLKTWYGLIDEALLNGETTVQVPTGMLRLVLIAPVFEADIPLLDAFTKAGKLDLVDDSRIVAAVSVWERQLRDYTSMAERARRDVDTQLLPALYKRADIGPLLTGPFITNLNGNDPMWSVPVVMNIDVEIKGLLAGRYARASDSFSDFEDLRAAAAEVVRAIDENSANP